MPDGRVPSSSRALEDTFARQGRWWHILFAALVVVTATIVTVGGGHRVPVQLGCIATWALAYAVWGRCGLNPANRSAAVAYLGCAWLCFLVLFGASGDGEQWILAFALYPQTWAMLPVRDATLVTVVGAVATGLATWAGVPHTQDAFMAVVLTTLIMVALSVVLGLFIHRLIGEAMGRAQTIDELHEARAQLVAAERDRGVHEERERLSREIHDTLAQGFTSVLALARAADSALARGDIATARGRLDLVTATAAENLSEARLIVAELTPGHLQSRTLVEALERLTAAMSTETGIRSRLRVEGSPEPLGGNAEVVLLRTAQEALSNVRRHSGAASADLLLAYRDDKVVLDVLDDGAGTEGSDTLARAAAGSLAGFGLDGVKARATELGGTVELCGPSGRGTRLRLTLPRAAATSTPDRTPQTGVPAGSESLNLQFAALGRGSERAGLADGTNDPPAEARS